MKRNSMVSPNQISMFDLGMLTADGNNITSRCVFTAAEPVRNVVSNAVNELDDDAFADVGLDAGEADTVVYTSAKGRTYVEPLISLGGDKITQAEINWVHKNVKVSVKHCPNHCTWDDVYQEGVIIYLQAIPKCLAKHPDWKSREYNHTMLNYLAHAIFNRMKDLMAKENSVVSTSTFYQKVRPQIAKLQKAGMTPSEIKEKLDITDAAYEKVMAADAVAISYSEYSGQDIGSDVNSRMEMSAANQVASAIAAYDEKASAEHDRQERICSEIGDAVSHLSDPLYADVINQMMRGGGMSDSGLPSKATIVFIRKKYGISAHDVYEAARKAKAEMRQLLDPSML